MKALIPNQQSQKIQEKRQQMHVPKDQIALMEEKGKEILNNLNPEHATKLNPKLSEERKRQLEVPKDQMAMIEEKQGKKDQADQMIKKTNQMKCGGKECHVKECDNKQCKNYLTAIKEENGGDSFQDLLDMNTQPIRIQPKMEIRESQEQFRRQMYNETQDNKEKSNDNSHDLERKEELTPQTAEKIMTEIKNDQQTEKQMQKSSKKKKSKQGQKMQGQNQMK